jgi:hypothetical protein
MTFNLSDLQQFTGTENWYRHPLNRSVLFTDGVRFVADRAGAYWLLDEIALAQRFQPRIRTEAFQVWRLVVDGQSATLICEDGNEQAVFSKRILYTDFPAPGVTIWCADQVLLLPSEY